MNESIFFLLIIKITNNLIKKYQLLKQNGCQSQKVSRVDRHAKSTNRFNLKDHKIPKIHSTNATANS